MRLRYPAFWAFALAAAVAPGALAQEDVRPARLKVGDPAPPLAVSKWVKGEPVEGFAPEEVYVVEFWATWCGPCRVSIPHLTELQEKYREQGVTVIGVDAFEPDPEEVLAFVEEMGDKMNYRVALDDVPAGGEPQEGKMALSWMEAAGQEGIPTAFIVDGKGRVAWIGHPMAMDETLAKVVDGTYDPTAAAEEARREAEEQEKKAEQVAALVAKLQLAEGPEDIKKIMPRFLEVLGDTPEARMQVELMKFNLLLAAGDDEGVAEAGLALLESPLGDNAEAMNNLAWTIVDPERPTEPGKAEMAFARKASEHAVKLTENRNWALIDTLARVRYLEGDAKAALELQERAVELAGDEIDADPEVKQRLEDYRKAAGPSKDDVKDH